MGKKFILCCFLAFSIAILPVSAIDMPFVPVTYDAWGDPTPGASGYEPTEEIDGSSLGVGAFLSPADISISPDQKTAYILDAGNNRLIRCDTNFKNAVVLDSFFTDGQKTELQEPTGIFASEDGVYIADKNNARVLKCNSSGEVLQTFDKPESVMFPQESDFLPVKVAVDSTGVVYVLCEGIYLGAVMYSSEGEFLGFYGSNKVQSNFSSVFNKFISSFISKDAKDRMEKYVPVEYNNFCIDKEDFVYTCTNTTDNNEMIKKLNASGVNVLATKAIQGLGFGDPKPQRIDGTLTISRFVDVSVDDKGYLYALDFTTGKVFVYDSDVNLMFVFGGSGTQNGLFVIPTAIESVGNRVYVLDKEKACITVFQQTEFGQLVDTAMDAYNDGRYEDALEPWNQVLKYNANYRLAYIGIGKANLESGNMETALENFKVAHYKSGYNDAYTEYRLDKMRTQFPIYFAVAVLFIVFIYRKNIPGINKLWNLLVTKIKNRTKARK